MPKRDDRREPDHKGYFIATDGLDGIGKGEIERALRAWEERNGNAVFDSISYSKAWEQLPELKDFWSIPRPHYNVIMTAEPTYEGVGKSIREEIIALNGRSYPARVQMELYSGNRLIQMERVIKPALAAGLTVLQSRTCAATLTYQTLKAIEEGRNEDEAKQEVLNHPGNKMQLIYRPDLLLIPTIKDESVLTSRLKLRGETRKEDNSEFENAVFQGRLKPLYESEWLRSLFTDRGTAVAYINAGISEEATRTQAVEIYKRFMVSHEIPERYRTVEKVLAD